MGRMQICVQEYSLTFAVAMLLHFVPFALFEGHEVTFGWWDTPSDPRATPERPPKTHVSRSRLLQSAEAICDLKMSSHETATVQRLDRTYWCVTTLTRTNLYNRDALFFSRSANDQGCILELQPWPRLASRSRLVVSLWEDMRRYSGCMSKAAQNTFVLGCFGAFVVH